MPVLDEPTEGIQPSIVKAISRVIRMLDDRGGIATLLVEQPHEFAQGRADDDLVLERGEFIARGSVNDVNANGVRHQVAMQSALGH